MDKKNKLMKCIGAILAAAVVTAVGGIASWYIPAGNMNDFEYSIVTLLFQGIVTAIGYILILVLGFVISNTFVKYKEILDEFIVIF